MPPSAFFQSKNEDFDNDTTFTPSVTNEQSLLDAVDAKVDPISKNKCRLLVHYRSDHK